MRGSDTVIIKGYGWSEEPKPTYWRVFSTLSTSGTSGRSVKAIVGWIETDYEDASLHRLFFREPKLRSQEFRGTLDDAKAVVAMKVRIMS